MSFIGIDSLSRKLVPLRPDFGGWSKLLFDFTLAEASLRSLGKHMGTQKSIVPREKVERHILFIRGQKVLLDSDLAEMYGVPTKRLNEAVKRNLDRFPDDFMFQLTVEEAEDLKS